MTAGDPIARLHRSITRLQWTAGVLAVATGVWAFWPQAVAPIAVAKVDDHAPASHKPVTPAVRSDFLALKLWTPPAPPAEAAKPAAPTPRPPLKLQLVGITRESGQGEGTVRAALYDPETDKLLIVASGEKVGVFTVTSLTNDEIGLADNQGVRMLSLRDDGRAK